KKVRAGKLSLRMNGMLVSPKTTACQHRDGQHVEFETRLRPPHPAPDPAPDVSGERGKLSGMPPASDSGRGVRRRNGHSTSGPPRGGCEQAEGAGPLYGLVAAVPAELGVEGPHAQFVTRMAQALLKV